MRTRRPLMVGIGTLVLVAALAPGAAGAREPVKGVKTIVVLGPPERNAGNVPVFSWKPVRGASVYHLVILSPGGPLWAWQGDETKVRLGGLPGKPQPGTGGPVLLPGSCWSVAALDDAAHVVAASSLRSVSPNGSKAKCGAKPAAKPAKPRKASGNEQIAFYSERDGNREVYVMGTDGSDQATLAANPTDDSDPVFSPDRKQIAFDSRREDDNKDIYVIKADGSSPRRLTTDENLDSYATWSPDGKKLAFTTTRDGLREIYVMNADGSGQTNLTKTPEGDDAYPAWSPDGTKIAFESYRDGNTEIYVMNADGSRQRNLTNNPAADSTADWSPDGRTIAFASDRDGDSEIYVMTANGGRQSRLTTVAGSDFGPVWSPDGKRLAFTSERDGNYEVYVIASDGSNPVRLTDDPASDFASDWA